MRYIQKTVQKFLKSENAFKNGPKLFTTITLKIIQNLSPTIELI